MRQMTITEATFEWIGQFSAIPMGVIEKLLANNPEELEEITLPAADDWVDITGGEYRGHQGEVQSVDPNDTGRYMVSISDADDDTPVSIGAQDLEVQRDYALPMHGRMWAFADGTDNAWLAGELGDNGLQKMSDCGFRIYRQEDYQYIFGIDGAGYDFYENHWIPLYKARDLRWHDDMQEAV